ncbi:MAG: histidine utilization repressor [Gammaproteobacteria bacterium]|nr:histidine utilization repressor [Gammaproteobacteria bacterium]
MATNSAGIPLYQMVKQHILELIDKDDWGEGRRLPSENELVKVLSISRMTINRALRELTNEGYIVRVSGVGTFVAEKRAQSHPLEIRNIAEEITHRGHVHESKVISLQAVRATPETALYFNIAAGARLFQSVILHSESGSPIQLEERYVHPAFAPAYMEEDFSAKTTTEYLLEISSSIDEIEQIVQAAMPSKSTSKLLSMSPDEPCLVLFRRTWVKQQVVTRTTLYHPASRYQFGSRYKP